jgi:hypothetical protein
MKYLIMIYLNQETFAALSDEERAAILAGHDAFHGPLRESGELVGFAALDDPTRSSTVRVVDGLPAVTDGPFAEVKEYLAGYYIVDCATRERAHELAAMIPDARYTPVEVRPALAVE